MPKKRKFKAIAWPYTDQVSNRRNSWYVVEVNDKDGSYFPHKGPVSRKYAHEEADRMQREWDEALAKQGCHCQPGEYCPQCEPRLRTTLG